MNPGSAKREREEPSGREKVPKLVRAVGFSASGRQPRIDVEPSCTSFANFSWRGRTRSALCEVPNSFFGTRPLGPELQRRSHCAQKTQHLRICKSVSSINSMWQSKVSRVLTEQSASGMRCLGTLELDPRRGQVPRKQTSN
jgi:hypothetical protein